MALHLPDPCVMLMVGAAGSGKSTLAAALASADPATGIVSYDAHQRRQPGDDGWQTCTPEAVAAAHIELAQRCATGASSIVDGTHRQPERRAAVRAIAAFHGLPVVAVALVVPLEECLARQHRRTRHVVPENIRAQHRAITKALPDLHREGYAAIMILNQPIDPAFRSKETNHAHGTTPHRDAASIDTAVARVITGERERIARELELIEEFCKDYTLETGEVLIPRDVAVRVARAGIGPSLGSRPPETGSAESGEEARS